MNRLRCWWSTNAGRHIRAADALQKLRIVQDGFRSAPEAEKFNEDFYLARGTIRPRKLEQ